MCHLSAYKAALRKLQYTEKERDSLREQLELEKRLHERTIHELQAAQTKLAAKGV